MPEPTKLPSAPSCIISAASAGVAIPPAQNSTTGRRPFSATSRTSSSGACSSFAAAGSSDRVHRREPPDLALDQPDMANRLHHVAGAGLALGADHRRALGDPPERLAQVGGAAHERHREGVLVDVVGLVRRRQDLGLVDVVHLERLEHLRLREMADARLGHHRDRHDALDLLDLGGIGHPRYAPGGADVRGNALERHHRDRSGLLGDLRLVGVDHVHDHAALEHLGEPRLDSEGAGLHLGQWYPARLSWLCTTTAAVPDRSGPGPPGRVAGEGAADVDQPAVHA